MQEPGGAAGEDHQGHAGRGELGHAEAPPAPGPPRETHRGHPAARGGGTDPFGDPGPEVSRRIAIGQRACPHGDALEIGQRGGAGSARPQMGLERRPVVGRKLVVEIFGEPVGPRIIHHHAPQRSRWRRSAIRARCSCDFEVPVGDAEHVRDLLVPIPFDVVQHEDLAGAVGELLDRRLEIHVQLDLCAAGRDHLEHRVALVMALPPDAEGLAPAEDHVDGQAVEPGAERRFAAKGPELLPRPDEDILRDLIGLLIAHHPAHQAVDPADVRAVESLERTGIAAGGQRRIHRIAIRPSDLFLAQRCNSGSRWCHRGELDAARGGKVGQARYWLVAGGRGAVPYSQPPPVANSQ